MIEINLLPEELRKKQPSRFTLPRGNPKMLLLPVLAMLTLSHILIQSVILIDTFIFKQVDKAFVKMQPQREEIDALKAQLERASAGEALFLRLHNQRFSAAPKLNALSDVLPQGVWLSGLSFSPEACELKGSCYSSSAQELAQIGSFLNALNSDKQIGKSFAHLELVSVQRRSLGATEVIDFAISSKSQAKQDAKKK